MQFHKMTLLEVLGKIAWVSRVKSQISLSGVQELFVCAQMTHGLVCDLGLWHYMVILT